MPCETVVSEGRLTGVLHSYGGLSIAGETRRRANLAQKSISDTSPILGTSSRMPSIVERRLISFRNKRMSGQSEKRIAAQIHKSNRNVREFGKPISKVDPRINLKQFRASVASESEINYENASESKLWNAQKVLSGQGSQAERVG